MLIEFQIKSDPSINQSKSKQHLHWSLGQVPLCGDSQSSIMDHECNISISRISEYINS